MSDGLMVMVISGQARENENVPVTASFTKTQLQLLKDGSVTLVITKKGHFAIVYFVNVQNEQGHNCCSYS